MKRKLSTTLLSLLFLAGSLLHAQTQVWTLQGPSSRHSHSAVFDPTSSQMIIFGGQATASGAGLNDVWLGTTSSNQSDSFAQLLPAGAAPAGRYGHVAAYDSASNRMMIFGGALGMPAPCANDIWILDSANGKRRNPAPSWFPQTPSGSLPAARMYASGAYDPNSNSLIVFGGNNCSTGYFNDVWVLSNANGQGGTPAWSQLATAGAPPAARQSATAVYDSTNNVLTIYAGDAGGAPFNDVWVLSNADGSGGTPTWSQLTPTGTLPPARTGHTAVYDAANNRMTIFGGTNRSITLTDTWILTSANGIGTPSWIQNTTTGTAPSVAYHSAVYDSHANAMYAFAGTSSAAKLSTNSHAFTLTNANGLAQTGARWVLGGIAVRYGQSAFYDTATNSLFVFGGQHAKNNQNFGDYWQASGVLGSINLKWNLVPTKSAAPSPRYGHTGLYDSGSDRLMIFGGSATSLGTCMNDYHLLQHANVVGGSPMWGTITAAGVLPAPRVFQASAYDAATNTIMIFGGFNCKTVFFNDVWILTNANNATGKPTWTQLNPVGIPPSVREGSSAVYDPTTNSLIVYGGDAGPKSAFSDLWILSNANGTGGAPAWTQLVPLNNGPVARSGHTATYDAVNNIMTIYAGFNGTSDLSDLWTLAGANGQTGTALWTQGSSGQPRRFASSVYDPASNTMITFGGSSSVNPLVPSADIYTLSDANGQP